MADFSGQELVSFPLEEGVIVAYSGQELVSFPLEEGAIAAYPGQELVNLAPEEGPVIYSVSSAMAGGGTYDAVLGLISSDLASTMVGGASQAADMGVNYAIDMSVAGGASFASEAGVLYDVDSSFDGSGDVVAAASVLYLVDSAMVGDAAQTAAAGLLYAVDASFVGDATLDSWVILHTKLGWCFFFGTGNINGDLGLVSFSWPFCNLYAGSELTAEAFSALFGTAAMDGGGTLDAPVLYNQFEMGTALASGGDSFIADAALKLAAISDLSGSASVLAEILVTLLIQSDMVGDAQMSADATLDIVLDSAMAGEGAFTATNLVGNIAADLVGDASILSAEATRILYVQANLYAQAEFVVPEMLWKPHPMEVLPPPSHNSGVTLYEFISSLGLTRMVTPTPVAQELAIVPLARSVIVEPVTVAAVTNIRYGWPFYYRSYGVSYSTYYTTATYSSYVFRR